MVDGIALYFLVSFVLAVLVFFCEPVAFREDFGLCMVFVFFWPLCLMAFVANEIFHRIRIRN